MASGQGFFKGEKKKKKQGQGGGQAFTTAPVFTPPKVIPKGKQEY